MLNIAFDKIDDRSQGIVVWYNIEIQSAAEKVCCAVGNKKLIW